MCYHTVSTAVPVIEDWNPTQVIGAQDRACASRLQPNAKCHDQPHCYFKNNNHQQNCGIVASPSARLIPKSPMVAHTAPPIAQSSWQLRMRQRLGCWAFTMRQTPHHELRPKMCARSSRYTSGYSTSNSYFFPQIRTLLKGCHTCMGIVEHKIVMTESNFLLILLMISSRFHRSGLSHLRIVWSS